MHAFLGFRIHVPVIFDKEFAIFPSDDTLVAMFIMGVTSVWLIPTWTYIIVIDKVSHMIH